MTVEEFKKLKPEFKDAEGDTLYNAMEDYMLRQQQGDEIIKQIMPIWKTHTFRWLFYRRKKNFLFAKNGISSTKMCKSCKKGVSSFLAFSYPTKNGEWKMESKCPFCREYLVRIPNTTINHKLYKFGKNIVNLFWVFLDKIHLVRVGSRYGMFGDESRYVKTWCYNETLTKESVIMKPRKWWEYILIEKPIHNF